MPINSVELRNYRNFELLNLSFSPEINIISGRNAQGKTNLIEAIFYFSTLKSFRSHKDTFLIRHDQPYAYLSETMHNGRRDFSMEITIREEKGKSILLNGISQTKASEVIGLLPAVLFTPDDLQLVKAGPTERRRLLDIPLCQIYPGYLIALSRYNKVLRMKKLLLKEPPDQNTLTLAAAYNSELAKAGSEVMLYRYEFAEKLANIAKEFHLSISQGEENLGLIYKTVSRADPALGQKENEARLFQRMEELKKNEFESQTCLTGIHKDDLILSINRFPAKIFASQGQMRSAALSLKLAERQLLKEETGCEPILLLDDVLSELDPQRQNFILNHMQVGQSFITCCDTVPFTMLNRGKIIELEKGKLLKETDL